MGSHIADKFLNLGYHVTGIDNLIGGYRENVPLEVEFVCEDLGDFDRVNDHFNGAELVIHAACTAYEGLSVFSPSFITRNTSHISTVAFSSAIKHGVKKFVHMSSMARYGKQDALPFTEDMVPKPQDPYGIAKYSSELLLRNISDTHGMDYVILVPHNIIGPRQKFDDPYRNVASIMINRILQGKQPIIYGDGSQKRCFSFINDVTSPVMKACQSDVVSRKIINIGPDEEFVSIFELAVKIAKIMNFNFDPIYFPERPQEVKDANCSAELARTLLGYKTSTSLENGLEMLINWITAKGPRKFNYHLPIEIRNEKTPETWTKEVI